MKQYDVVVIGAGPGGYVAAIRAAQLGLSVACVDRFQAFGGTCLRVGCIPSKALLESSHQFELLQHGLADHGIKVRKAQLDLAQMLRRKDQIVERLTGGVRSLLKKNKVEAVVGRARLAAANQVDVETDSGTVSLGGKSVIVATGSRPATLPGVDLDDNWIGTSTAALTYPDVPPHLVVIGAGYIGLELGSVWRRLGAKVTVLEALPRILPGTDAELAELAKKIFARQGLEFRLDCRVQSARRDGKQCLVTLHDKQTIRCDRVLLAIGRWANTDGLGLDEAGVERDDRGRIVIDAQFGTSVEGVYAIGDCVAGPMLAHKASEEGIACAQQIAGRAGHVDYDTVPAVIYTHPEIASVGKTQDQLEAEGRAFVRGSFPFRANGRALTLGDSDGLVKILADQHTDRLLGVHILGPRAGDLIAEAAVAMQFHASSEDLAACWHAHPTLSEAVREAALASYDKAIHG